MPDFNNSPNMNLPIPTVSVAPGPQWASYLNSSLTLVDQHDHTPGKGVQLTPDSFDINSDFSLNENNLLDVRSIRLSIQNAVFSDPADINALYDVSGDLYFSDGSGNQVRITQSGNVAGTPGSIANLVSPASASYVSGNQTFVWESDATVPANMDAGSLILRNISAASFGLTLSPPSLASNYTITLPALPLSTKVLSISTSGALATSVAGAVGTVDIADGAVTAVKLASDSVTTVKILDLNVTTGKINDLAVTTGKINTAAVTQAKKEIRTTGTTVGAGGVAVSNSSGSFSTSSGSYVDVTNLTVTIITLGNPVVLKLVAGGTSGDESIITLSGISTLKFLRGATSLPEYNMSNVSTGGTVSIPSSAIQYMDIPAAGTYTYKLQAKSTASVDINYAKLVAYEL